MSIASQRPASLARLAVVALIVAAIASACGGVSQSTILQTIGTGTTPLRVGLGYIPSVQFAPFYLADQAGYYKDAGLEVTFENGNDPDIIRLTGTGSYDIGIAISTDAGLMVCALRDADRLSIVEIAKEIERLGAAAKAGKVQKEDLGGTSFTISSLGKLGGLMAPPIINYPEVGIMGVHAIKRKPVVKGDQIVIGDVMNLSFSFDHRIIDGDVGAAFAQEIIGYLEQPDRLLVEMS